MGKGDTKLPDGDKRFKQEQPTIGILRQEDQRPATNAEAPVRHQGFPLFDRMDQTTPWSSIASATFTKPAMLAPFT